MRAPAFWWRRPGLAAALLAPAAGLYGALAARRLARRGERIGIPVICVGDLTVGGSGKTPAALLTARVLAENGERPVFLTRGYGGRSRGPVLVDVARHRHADVGDEPLLLARATPTIVARDRLAGARAAREAGATVIVMDDGFQNPSVAKDLSILVLDGAWGIGNCRVLPAGPLRAPLADQLARANALIVIGEQAEAAAALTTSLPRSVSLVSAQLQPQPEALAALAGRRVLAFAGIGHPEKFFHTLRRAGVEVAAQRAYPDHHSYRPADAADLLAHAEREGLTLVTTEKDRVRLAGEAALEILAHRSVALLVTLVVERETAFRYMVLNALARHHLEARRSSG